MLKLATMEEERAGGVLMEWWGGSGAARVLKQAGAALLIERAIGPRSLSAMALDGRDDEACSILCSTAARLHAPRAKPLPRLVPLADWFRPLGWAAATYGGVLSRCHVASGELLSSAQEVVPLHGDLHHGNVLDFGSQGWLAIDPKALLGERGFDFANIFCNPDLVMAGEPERFRRRLEVITKAAGLDRTRLLLWIVAWCGLSTAFCLEDDDGEPSRPLRLAEIAEAELHR